MELCKLWVNGKEIAVDPERKLMDILRNDLRLKSVKDGCSEGACGTCTVIIDGKATKSCVQKAQRLAGKHITTVEGLSQRERMSLFMPLAKPVRCSVAFVFPVWSSVAKPFSM